MEALTTWTSRKYKSAWGLTWLATALLVVPWAIGLIPSFTFVSIIEAGTWSMLLTAIWSTYFASNVASKYVATLDTKSTESPSESNTGA